MYDTYVGGVHDKTVNGSIGPRVACGRLPSFMKPITELLLLDVQLPDLVRGQGFPFLIMRLHEIVCDIRTNRFLGGLDNLFDWTSVRDHVSE
jgi:hypothetical protein